MNGSFFGLLPFSCWYNGFSSRGSWTCLEEMVSCDISFLSGVHSMSCDNMDGGC